MKKKRLISSILLLVLTGTMLTGCSQLDRVKDVIKPKEEAPKDYSAKIKKETSTNIVDESELETGNFYVMHKDKFYSLASYSTAFPDDVSDLETADTTYHAFFDLTQEENIPTMFLENDDKLVYYSEDTLLDYVSFERFRDDGYTISGYNYNILSGGQAYLSMSDGLDKTVVLDTDLYKQLSDLGVANDLLIDKVNKTKITKDYITDGILYGLKPNQECNLQAYEGTIYHNIKTTAEVHAFTNFELFKSAEYTPLKIENLYEVTIPKYFKNGYYWVNDIGMVRIITSGKSYILNDFDSFNNPILEAIEDYDGTIKLPQVYSEVSELNQYKSETPGALGYVEPESDTTTTDSEKTDTKKPVIGKTNTKYFKVTANDTSGIIYVNSDETDGNVILYTNTGKKTYAEYKTDAKRYEITLNDKDIKDTKEFVIATSGFAEKFEMSTPEGWKIENTTRDKVKDFVNNTSSKGENER